MSKAIQKVISPERKVWAINLADSKIRRWNGSVQDRLIVDWHEYVGNAGRVQKDVLNIEIARKASAFSAKEVMNLTDEILTFQKVSTGDLILGYSSVNTVGKAGYVNETETVTKSRKDIIITWVPSIQPFSSPDPLFSKDKGIQLVKYALINKIDLDFSLLDDIAPSIFSDDINYDAESFTNFTGSEEVSSMDAADNNGKIKLFFGTNRRKSGDTKLNKFFSNQIGDELLVGSCVVNIPASHTMGELERPSIWRFEFNENPDRDVMLDSIDIMTVESFQESIRMDAANFKEPEAFVFIHGYNVKFDEAARRTGQLAWDIPFKGIAGFFSWPTGDGVASYLADIEKADRSISSFSQFLQYLLEDCQLQKIHLLAHSMGNRILATTLSDMAKDTGLKDKLSLIHQIILGAADLDQGVFRTNILPAFNQVGIRRTLYASEDDLAINASTFLRADQPRLGAGGRNIFIAEGIDTVDSTSAAVGADNHSYIFEKKELLTDLFFLIQHGFAPVQRRLRQLNGPSGSYWIV